MSIWGKILGASAGFALGGPLGALAGAVARLGTFRAPLRERIACSPLCDASTYARDVEDAYREMWQKWCRQAKNLPDTK